MSLRRILIVSFGTVSAIALSCSAAHARERAPRRAVDPLAITGATLLIAGAVAIAGGAALHVFAKRAERRFDAAFEQRGPTGFSTLTWSDAQVHRRQFQRWGTAAALSYGIAVVGIPVGAVLVATGIRRARARARLLAAPSAAGVDLVVRVEF